MTKYDWQLLKEIALTMATLVIVIAALGGAVAWVLKTSYGPYREPGNICAKAGYPEARYISGDWYCIGIRDGSSVMVPVGEVGR